MSGLTKSTYLNKSNVKLVIYVGGYVLLSQFLFTLTILPPLIYYLLLLTYCAMGYVILIQVIDAVIELKKRLKLSEIKKYLHKNN